MDTDGANFAFAGGTRLIVQAAPYACESRNAAGADAIDSTEPDQGLFHHANEVDGAEAAAFGVLETAKVEDRISDELSGTVIRDVAPPVDVVERDTATGEKFVGREDVGSTCVSAQGEHWRVLEKKECVFDETCKAQGSDLGLKLQRDVVACASEIEVLDHSVIVWMQP